MSETKDQTAVTAEHFVIPEGLKIAEERDFERGVQLFMHMEAILAQPFGDRSLPVFRDVSDYEVEAELIVINPAHPDSDSWLRSKQQQLGSLLRGHGEDEAGIGMFLQNLIDDHKAIYLKENDLELANVLARKIGIFLDEKGEIVKSNKRIRLLSRTMTDPQTGQTHIYNAFYNRDPGELNYWRTIGLRLNVLLGNRRDSQTVNTIKNVLNDVASKGRVGSVE